jgi:1-phosphofructokinase
MVLAPAPRLTVTIETRGAVPDIHLHAGGQGVWQARMVRAMGVPTVLCAAFGGESGRVVRCLLDDDDFDLRAVAGPARTGGYVHDRRRGSRSVLAETPGEPLDRHEVDELYGVALTEGLVAGVALLGGPGEPPVLDADFYRRLATDLRRNGCTVLADLSGAHLTAVAAGRPSLVKVGHDELTAAGRAGSDRIEDLIEAAHALHREGAGSVLVTRSDQPALALVDGNLFEAVGPDLETADPRGAGDSTVAAIAAAVARGEGVTEAIRVGIAAGALNVTRHGLGTGRAEAVAQLRERVQLRERIPH